MSEISNHTEMEDVLPQVSGGDKTLFQEVEIGSVNGDVETKGPMVEIQIDDPGHIGVYRKGVYKGFPNPFKRKMVEKYYEQQKEIQEQFEADRELISPSNAESGEKAAAKRARLEETRDFLEKVSLNLSFFCNIFLFIIKLTASFVTLSISVIASTLDSFLDLLSGTIIYIATKIRNRKGKMDFYYFPVGKSRIEPIGIVIFASVMATASFQVIGEAAREIVNYMTTPIKWGQETDLQKYMGIAVLAFTIIVKGFLYLLCRFQYWSPSIQALADDHRNDVVSNSIVLVAVTISNLVYPQYTFWLDPAGAILISVYIIFNWVKNMYGYAQKLVGKTADPVFIQRLIRVSLDHSEKIIHVERVSAFYVGLGIYVEIDLVLDPETPLKESHDIGEALQNKIEKLEEVERCFVHLDYETLHTAELEHKKIL